jgi:hypothetical protein
MTIFQNFSDAACAVAIFLSFVSVVAVSLLFTILEKVNMSCYATLGIPPLCYSPDGIDIIDDEIYPVNDDDVTVRLEDDDKDWYLFNEEGHDEPLFPKDYQSGGGFIFLPLTSSDGCPLHVLP